MHKLYKCALNEYKLFEPLSTHHEDISLHWRNKTLCNIQVNELQSALANERGRASSGSQALSESKSRIESLVAKVSELETANLKLNQKISDLAQTVEDHNSSHRAQVG